MVKKITAGFIPFILMHLLCCGALLFFLISSGYLLILRQEGSNKVLLLPLLLLTVVVFGLYKHHGKCCNAKGHKTNADRVISFLLYIALSLILGLAFMTYVFIPWWIPNYKGGILLP